MGTRIIIDRWPHTRICKLQYSRSRQKEQIKGEENIDKY